MKQILNKITAYIRLKNQELKSQRIEETANMIRKALYAKCHNDLERSKALEIANKQFEIDLEQRKEKQMQEVVITEQAHDIMRMVNLKY